MDDSGNAHTVVLAEDDGFLRTLLAMALEEAGFRVIEAGDATAAIRALEKGGKISAVITDVRMPGPVDGVGLAGWMREHTPGIPVILASGFAFQGDLAHINPAIPIIVKKPYDPEEVVRWVESLVKAPGSVVIPSRGGRSQLR